MSAFETADFLPILNHLEDVVFFKDTEGCYRLINKAGAQALGRPVEEILGAKDEVLFDPEQGRDIQRIDREIMLSGKPKTYERERQYGGQSRFYWTHKTPVYNEQGELMGLMGIARDVTARKQMEKALETAKRAAEAADHAKTRFMANMSHEIRTPFNAVMGLVELLYAELPKVEASDLFRDRFERLLKAVGQLYRLNHDLLALSKIETGRETLTTEQFAVSDVVDVVWSSFKDLAEREQVIVRKQVDADVWPFLLTDRTKLTQILTNFVSNAVKFTPAGGDVLIHARGAGNELVFRVKDEGPGIPPAYLETIFEWFDRGNQHDQDSDGMGLGLAISKQLADLLGARITLDSVPGQGSCFSLYLPPALRLETPLLTTDPGPQESNLKGLKILVVEDNPINRLTIEALLSELGIEVILAEDGPHGLRALDQDPDLVFMDIRMPGWNGIETTRRMRDSLDHHLPIVGLSAEALDQSRREALAAGMDDFLSKPLTRERLIRMITTHLSTAEKLEP